LPDSSRDFLTDYGVILTDQLAPTAAVGFDTCVTRIEKVASSAKVEDATLFVHVVAVPVMLQASVDATPAFITVNVEVDPTPGAAPKRIDKRVALPAGNVVSAAASVAVAGPDVK
jgi:hypothetical protein